MVFGSDRKGVKEDYKKLHNEQPHDIKYYSRDQIQVRIEQKRNASRFGCDGADWAYVVQGIDKGQGLLKT